MAAVRVLAFGGCNIRAPMVRAQHRRARRDAALWDVVPDGYRIVGPPFFTYTVGEMAQAIACYRGERRIPAELETLCNMRPNTTPLPRNSPLDKCDAAIVEPNTSIEIMLDGWHINRRPILQLVAPLRAANAEASQLTNQWFERGIAAQDEETRRETATKLLASLPRDLPRRDLVARVLSDARPSKPPLKEGLRALAESLGAPVGVAVFTWAFMPDGRALSWPSDFLGEVTAAAAELGLPLFDPREKIREIGVATAVEADLRHYSQAFLPIIAKPLVEFALRLGGGSGGPAPTGASLVGGDDGS